jgi:hypothetical protein
MATDVLSFVIMSRDPLNVSVQQVLPMSKVKVMTVNQRVSEINLVVC